MATEHEIISRLVAVITEADVDPDYGAWLLRRAAGSLERRGRPEADLGVPPEVPEQCVIGWLMGELTTEEAVAEGKAGKT
jgi:hypothetical protein